MTRTHPLTVTGPPFSAPSTVAMADCTGMSCRCCFGVIVVVLAAWREMHARATD